MSLNTSQLYVTDVRSDAFYVGEKINVPEYIEKIRPDCVMVFYSGAPLGDDLYNFD